MIKISSISLLTKEHFDLTKITEKVENIVKQSHIQSGLVVVMTTHTTTGIIVNEGLPCLESDIKTTLRNLVPDDYPYVHAHWLPNYGRTSANATGHLRSMLVGNSCIFPVENSKMVLGDAQDVYLAEFDGPQNRKIYIEVIGE
jgi:secondary thiamine-phosphate synthase enzyme